MFSFRMRFSFLIGALMGAAIMQWVPEVGAVLETSDKGIYYRVIGESKDSKMERELNELTDCRPIFVFDGSVRSDPMVILECR